MGIKYVSNNALARAVSKIRGLIGAVEARLVPASTGQAGLVKLNNTLASASTAEALTAAQGKVLSDRLQTLSGQTYKFYEKYNFNVDEIAEDCIRITGGTTTGTKPPGGLYSLVFSYYPKSADGYTDGNYIVQTAIADNGKVYTRYNYSTPPSWTSGVGSVRCPAGARWRGSVSCPGTRDCCARSFRRAWGKRRRTSRWRAFTS